MVFGQIQQHRHVRVEIHDPFQLERAYLSHHPLHTLARSHEVDEGLADIAADKRAEAASLENLAGKRRRRGLAVGAGYGGQGRIDKGCCQLYFTYDGNAAAPGQSERRDIHGHPGAHDDQVRRPEGMLAVPPELELQSEPLQ